VEIYREQNAERWDIAGQKAGVHRHTSAPGTRKEALETALAELLKHFACPSEEELFVPSRLRLENPCLEIRASA
jgi:hypothetical protein